MFYFLSSESGLTRLICCEAFLYLKFVINYEACIIKNKLSKKKRSSQRKLTKTDLFRPPNNGRVRPAGISSVKISRWGTWRTLYSRRTRTKKGKFRKGCGALRILWVKMKRLESKWITSSDLKERNGFSRTFIRESSLEDGHALWYRITLP